MDVQTRAIVPVTEHSSEEAIAQARRIPKNLGIDEVEIRLDSWKNLDLNSLRRFIAYAPSGFVYRYTCRHREESGPDLNCGFRALETEEANEFLRISLLQQALVGGPIDAEYRTSSELTNLLIQTASALNRDVNISLHFWEDFPDLVRLRDQVLMIDALNESYTLNNPKRAKRVYAKVVLPVYSAQNALDGLSFLEDVNMSGLQSTIAFISKKGSENLARTARVLSCLNGSRDQFFFYGRGNASGQVAIEERYKLQARARRLIGEGELKSWDSDSFSDFAKELFSG